MSLSTAQPRESAAQDTSIGVMVVDDSAVVRGLVSRWVEEDPALTLVGKFANGQQAVDGIVECRPDVVILDIEMPVLDGMTALPQLLQRLPDAKVIMSSTLTRRNAEISLKALSLGAVDYIAKPEGNSGVTTSSTFREELLAKVKGVGCPTARTAPALPPKSARVAAPVAAGERPALRRFSPVRPRVLAIGSSTGGPKMLATLFKTLGPSLAGVPVLVTQHMPATFTAILAEHLGQEAGRPSKEAVDGEPLRPGTIYVAPGGRHMALTRQGNAVATRIYDGPDINFCKPAVDPLFESVAAIYGRAALGLVLTGMGHDGAAGALRIADSGGSIIAQDEATSVVWGMPGAAVAAGACAAVLSATDIGRKVTQLLTGGAS